MQMCLLFPLFENERKEIGDICRLFTKIRENGLYAALNSILSVSDNGCFYLFSLPPEICQTKRDD